MVWHGIHLSAIAKQVCVGYGRLPPSMPWPCAFHLITLTSSFSLATTYKLPAIRGYLQEDGRLIDLQDETYRMSPLIWSVCSYGEGSEEGRDGEA